MLSRIRTSSSDLHLIKNFRYVVQLTKGMKCDLYYLSASTECLYGTSKEYGVIHEAPVPFQVSNDIVFCTNLIDTEILERNGDMDYFIPDMFPWAIIPVKYWDEYVRGDIYEWYHPERGTRYLVNKNTDDFVDYLIIIRMDQSYGTYAPLVQQVDCMRNILNGPIDGPYTFYDMHKDDTIQSIFQNKVSEGRKIINLITDTNKSVVFYLFKTMFTMNKNDKLSIDVFFHPDCPTHNTIVFKPIRKKAPPGVDIPFQERIYCMVLNLANS